MISPEKLEKYIDDFNGTLKIRVDLFKHLSSLSSGTIVVVAAFIREIPPASCKGLLAASLALFVLTIVFSAWASFYTLGYMLTAKRYSVGEETLENFVRIDQGRFVGIMPILFFISGMITLIFFVFSVM